MASKDPHPGGASAGNSTIPEAVIEQAEAAAISEETSDGGPLSQTQTEKHKLARSTTAKSRKGENASSDERPIEQVPSLVYGAKLGQVDFSQDGFNTEAKVADDGRLNININQKSQRLSELLVPALRSQLNIQQYPDVSQTPDYIPPALTGAPGKESPPPLNVVIHVVGSRGDVQPFVALGKVLKEKHHHRVRLATHGTFRDFVEENGLEFFSIGGDPAELMAFMVKNPGLMPGVESLRAGDVGKRRKGMYEIVQGCWRSCIEVGDGTGIRASDEHLESRTSLDSGIGMDDPATKPFVADAIIANPPSFAHVHIAEKMGIPLHLMFTMPWSPTQAFPHPLANIQSSNAEPSVNNFMSYALVEMMTWQGLGDIINRFREKYLQLEPVSLIWAPGMASRLKIPYTYCWSPVLIPKPRDWGSHISISGFFFLNLASNYTPAPDLAAFLDAGPPPVYIGFGSIVVDDPDAMTKLIFEAVQKTGQRALVSKGWGGFGADEMGIPDGVFMLGNVPHDWLFKRVSCVVHHGGAGTTAAGIALGVPTVVVPFFGDQPFWGAMVARAGAGPLPIHSKTLTAEKLADAITEALKPSTKERAQELGAKISSEKGSEVAADSFHGKLDIDSMRCLAAPKRAAVWRVKRTTIRLSAFAATVLSNEGLLDFSNLKLYRPMEYDTEDGPWDPITGGASALMGTIGSLMMGFADFPVEIIRALKPKQNQSAADDSASTASITEKSKSLNSSKMSLGSTSSNTEDNVGPLDDASTPALTPQDSHELISPVETDDQSLNSKKFNHRSSMRDALKGSISRSNSRGSSPSRSSGLPHRTMSGDRATQISVDAAVGAGKSIRQVVGAGVKSPMDFTISIAKGFHNAPKLYGDDTVRQSDKVTGLQSGLKAAGKEFGFGFYDGISGLVTQPLEGAKKEGFAGLLKGFGKGIGGVVLKPGAAIWGLPGYTFTGIYKELQKHLGSSTQNYIVAARTAQGYEEWHNSTREERLDVVARWQAIQIEVEKEKHHARHGSFGGSHCYLKSTIEERKKKHAEKKKNKKAHRNSNTSARLIPPSHPFASQTRKTTSASESPDSEDFEEAIIASVAATSKGDPEQDKMIEKAIRASVKELQSAQRDGNDQDALARAIKASVAEAAKERKAQEQQHSDGAHDEHDIELELALQRSISEHPGNHPLTGVDFDDSGVDTDDDEHVKTAIKRSKSAAVEDPVEEVPNDEDFQKALETSKKEHEEGLSKQRTEEEIVLDYIKKQSLAEEEHRKNIAAKEG